MIYLTLEEVIQLHDWLIAQSGGGSGIIDRGLIESALYQPQATFGGHELCPTLEEKAAVLAFSLALNHAFVDGNKRIAHAAMETFLVRNGHEIQADVDEQEAIFLRLAAGALTREEFTEWVRLHTVPLAGG
jgi:death-on-curing protein